MIDADAGWFRRLEQSLEYATGFELFVFVGPAGLAQRGLLALAEQLGRFGQPRWHTLANDGLDRLFAGAEPGVLHLVHGLEHLPAAAARGLVARLNVSREQLRELGRPVFLWVPEGFYEEFLREAPDLFAWRSQVAVVSARDFEPEPEPEPPAKLAKPPRVYISYSHDSAEHRERVIELAQRLRRDGIDAWIDRFEPAPPQGWPRWMQEQLERADFILVVCTPIYRQRFEGSRTINWEGMLAVQLLYSLDFETIVPVMFEDHGDDAVPLALRPATHHRLPDDYAGLVRRLLRRSPGAPAPLAEAPRFAGMPDSPQIVDQVAALHDELNHRASAGEPTEDLRKAILELRRQLRSGPRSATGDTLAGRYELLEIAGSGGFATVWKAWDASADRLVAVKVLHGQWSRDHSKIARFDAGAQRMATLRHPAIVPILAPAQGDQSHHFFVMPWFAGGDLQRALSSGAIDRDVALLACARAIEGLIHVHDHGLVHRDIKPSNILLDDEHRGWLTDFDLVWSPDTTHGTRTGAGLGSFTYAAPESLRDAASVDARADLYGAAMCVLFVLLKRHPPPLVAATEPELLERLPCSEELRAAITGALAYKPDRRTTTGAQLVTAIREFVADPSSAPARARSTPWASEGEDQYGRWAMVRVAEVEQRMRWIGPGTFSMGSPASEPGRFDDEGPQHEVTLTAGYWLSETPCTQALWIAVMGDNPSRFPSPERPVEHLAWDDVQRFLDRLAQLLPGAPFGLPSEAQWEHACRAGTTSATYGPLDAIAWHWHNSGGTTQAVGRKQPNAWGLHDMLGNIWEWCSDGQRMFTHQPVSNPSGPKDRVRVCRGGSWGDDARFARSACRISYEPSYRYGSVGFRLVLAAS